MEKYKYIPLFFVFILLHIGLAYGLASKANVSKQPNIVLILGDDLSFRDIEPYGNTQVRTPHIARLAREGMSLDNMFTATAMCAPSRQQLYTGLYPVRNSAYPNHSQVHPGTKSVAHHLQALGYHTALIGKKHYKPEIAFPFQYLGGRDHDNGKGQDIDLKLAERFIQGTAGKPYLLVVTSNQPHGPLNRGNAAAYPVNTIKVPPHLVDTRETRKQLADYYAEITYLDSLVGVVLNLVERSGQKDNTLVIFTTEQGSSAPFGKWTCYDSGLKTGFIARWPGHIKPGSRSAVMTQYVDVVPTLIELAGGNPESVNTGSKDAKGETGFDGKSFKQILTGHTNKFRDYVFGVHTTRGIINGSDAYPIRSVRSNKYLYIHNLNHTAAFSNVETNSAQFKSWFKTGIAADAARAQWYVQRPEEELYEVKNDPYQLVNLAGKAVLQKEKHELKRQLAAWMKQQGDLGLETEMKALERIPKNENDAATPAKKKKKAGNK